MLPFTIMVVIQKMFTFGDFYTELGYSWMELFGQQVFVGNQRPSPGGLSKILPRIDIFG